jgi:HlyD family secretion protein
VPSQAVLAREVEELPLDVREKTSDVDKNKTFATVVYKYADGKAAATPVKIGASDLTHTVILSGLKEGDKVIVGPYKVLEKLKHEQKVRDEQVVEAEKKAKEKSQKAKVKSKKDANDGNEPAGK